MHGIGFDVMGYVLRGRKHFHGLEIAKQMTLLWKNGCQDWCMCLTRTGCRRFLVKEKMMAGWRRQAWAHFSHVVSSILHVLELVAR